MLRKTRSAANKRTIFSVAATGGGLGFRPLARLWAVEGHRPVVRGGGNYKKWKIEI